MGLWGIFENFLVVVGWGLMWVPGGLSVGCGASGPYMVVRWKGCVRRRVKWMGERKYHNYLGKCVFRASYLCMFHFEKLAS
jgi:hypothetical protein